MPHHVAPRFKEDFSCPNCGIYTMHIWVSVFSNIEFEDSENERLPFHLSKCLNCDFQMLWRDEKIVYPLLSTAPIAADDMPTDVREDFEEARNVFALSPRSAAALLRLAMQKLMPHLGEKGKHLNTDIASLVKRGLTPGVQQALDALRVIGNEAVHPGELRLKDDRQTALALFELLNFIVEQMITHPKELQGIYSRLPESSRKAIAERDGIVMEPSLNQETTA